MFIRSNFKDYYDTILGLGFDSGVIYNRFNRTKEIKDGWPKGTSSPFGYNYPTLKCEADIHRERIIVGFCGQWHLCLLLYKTELSGRKHFVYAYTETHVASFIKQRFPKDYDAYCEQVKQNTLRPSILKYFQLTPEAIADLNKLNLFGEDTPIVVIRRADIYNYRNHDIEVTFNARLQDIDFHKHKDAYQTFQEIAMWLANQAEPRKPIPPIDDITMAEAKGFDKRFSFRKPKSKQA